MISPFSALRVREVGGQISAQIERLELGDLTPGEVVVRVHYSGLNYKDALAVTGKGRILKSYPLNAGIDAAGVVISSDSAKFTPGQQVLVTGCGIGENYDGGYSEVLRVAAESVVPLPDGLSLREAMTLGTAGFTAALALARMEQNGQRPELGPILITGASGGVGSFAVQLFSQNGYEVHAVSGKPSAKAYLEKLGAHQVLTPDELKLGSRPLEKARFGGAVDNVGGLLLAQILAHVQLWGNVTSIGLAQSAEFSATVMPFILRGVSLLGTSSNNCPRELRHEMWRKLAGPWRPKGLNEVVAKTVTLAQLLPAFDELLRRQIQGRILVEIQK